MLGYEGEGGWLHVWCGPLDLHWFNARGEYAVFTWKPLFQQLPGVGLWTLHWLNLTLLVSYCRPQPA